MDSIVPADPRSRNEWTVRENISDSFRDYRAALVRALDSVETRALENAYTIMNKVALSGKTIFTAGNGGSAAIANHLCCDWSKGTFIENKVRLKTHSLCANVELMTAMANDMGLEHMFAQQLKILGSSEDGLLLISSSGNSPNILQTALEAKSIGMPVIGLSGFSGGRLKELADVAIHVPMNNYGIVEDVHQAVMHSLAQYFFLDKSR